MWLVNRSSYLHEKYLQPTIIWNPVDQRHSWKLTLTPPPPHPNLIILTIKSRWTVSKFWRCSSISFKHTYVGCMFLDPHLTVHPLRYRCPFKTSKVTELRPLTQVSGEASMGNDMASKEWRYRSLKVAFFFLSPSNSHVSPLLLIDSCDPRSGQQS